MKFLIAYYCIKIENWTKFKEYVCLLLIKFYFKNQVLNIEIKSCTRENFNQI